MNKKIYKRSLYQIKKNLEFFKVLKYGKSLGNVNTKIKDETVINLEEKIVDETLLLIESENLSLILARNK